MIFVFTLQTYKVFKNLIGLKPIEPQRRKDLIFNYSASLRLCGEVKLILSDYLNHSKPSKQPLT